jgi:hypothetical protein
MDADTGCTPISLDWKTTTSGKWRPFFSPSEICVTTPSACPTFAPRGRQITLSWVLAFVMGTHVNAIRCRRPAGFTTPNKTRFSCYRTFFFHLAAFL